MSDHLSVTLVNSLADNELSPAQAAEVSAHLAECATCTTKALSQMMLKRATAHTGRRYDLPPEMRERFLAPDAASPARAKPIWIGWARSVAAMLILVTGIGLMQRRSSDKAEEAALVTEITDQHVSGMAANQPPEVLSSDRHTVKPWFQGKIPFSFNLPDGLAADTTLDGANLVYQGHRPAAQLLYTIGKHRVSVFLCAKESGRREADIAAEQSGFHIAALHAGELYIVAVSDVERTRLDALANAIRNAQSP